MRVESIQEDIPVRSVLGSKPVAQSLQIRHIVGTPSVWPGSSLFYIPLSIPGARIMRTPSARTTVISLTALVVALIWGAVEFVALQWTGFMERWQTTKAF
jgi:hypothetical protein